MSSVNMLQDRKILAYTKIYSDASLSDINIPETDQNRERTDRLFLFVFIGFIVLLIPFLVYTLYYSDIRRRNGYDDCGNICGEKNIKYDQWNCTGKDLTYLPEYTDDGACVAVSPKSSWDDYDDKIHEATYFDSYNSHDKNFYIYVGRVGWKIALSSFLSVAYCIIMVILLRYVTAVLVWGILIFSWTLLLSFMVFTWIYVIITGGSNGGIGGAITLLILVVTLLCVMIFMKNRIRLAIMLIKEATKAVFDMKLIFFVSLMTIFSLTIIVSTWVVLMNHISTSGILTELPDGVLEYVPNTWMLVTLYFNLIMAYWVIQFINGIQYMIISGAISKWYFARDKAQMESPIFTSAVTAFKFHLGTIALGSLMITLVAILRAFLRGLARHPRFRGFVECCTDYLEAFVKYFTKNSYIITAMHGTPFFKSGRQAVKLIALNICNTIAVNNVSDFVFTMALMLIGYLSILTTYIVFLGEEDNAPYFLYSCIIVVAFALICSFTILVTFQNAVDTMFLCFCEDCLINDGMDKPYAMSRGFMEFVDSSKKTFARQIREKSLPTI